MSENLPDPGDQNVERLLGEAYQPEAIDEGLAERVLARLEKVASERRRKLSEPEPTPWRRIAWLYFANAVAIILLIVLPSLFWHYFLAPEREQKKQDKEKKTTPYPSRPRPHPSAFGVRQSSAAFCLRKNKSGRGLPHSKDHSVTHDDSTLLYTQHQQQRHRLFCYFRHSPECKP